MSRSREAHSWLRMVPRHDYPDTAPGDRHHQLPKADSRPHSSPSYLQVCTVLEHPSSAMRHHADPRTCLCAVSAASQLEDPIAS
ncbi:hypothetical protein ISF_01268 [Cordyceps fumosorosea ARSEF 2679]|uniref:Uncharacterized protein n=1 Tax=Cordyceps fumosorosea (strain ARSEF 2679) TaxID=1081104 RepID=A0A168D5I4_CORFA|nr:hypothetical protein ISF_01268 [Cordyceps fumosorosea ARSEF 2679]OAA72195.1 hypothetical protein ISF_01268 [Cordyceps fumosorosea ARSEF 2679]